jgi:uncharacterized protein YegP (UPF0339 family)
MARPRAKRVTIYRDSEGQWRYRAVAGNWREIGASEEGHVQKGYVLRKVAALYPGVEIIVVT